MTTPDKSRREFLWDTAKMFSWGALTLTCVPVALATDKDGAGAQDKKPQKARLYGFLVDTTKCIGCGGCVVACKTENGVPDGQFRTWVERYTYFKDGEVRVDTNRNGNFSFGELPQVDLAAVDKSFFVPKLCNHCENTPCVQVCPVGASYVNDFGVVLVDDERCIGCSYCVQACPFGTRFINTETHVADKCTWCYHRVDKGFMPACVEVCPTGTRVFGDITDPESEISKLLAANRIDVLKSYLGTRPHTRYIGLTAEVV